MSFTEPNLLYTPTGKDEEELFPWHKFGVQQHIFSGHKDELFATPWLSNPEQLSYLFGKLDRIIWALREHTAEEIVDMGFNLHVDLTKLGIDHTTLYLNAMDDTVYLMSYPRPYIVIDVTSDYAKDTRTLDSQLWLQICMCMSLGSSIDGGAIVRADYTKYILDHGINTLDSFALGVMNATDFVTLPNDDGKFLFLTHPRLGNDYAKEVREKLTG